jgi:methylated-DNA-[protein]-cysteine S-methyltransferase
VRLALPTEDVEATLSDLAARISPRVLEAPAQLDRERRELEDYFEGRRQEFDLPIDWQLSHGFLLRARQGIAAIPYGETRTYADLARGAGNERAVRAAGSACSRNPIPLVVPCHRVVRSDGSMGLYAGGVEMKRKLLELENQSG